MNFCVETNTVLLYLHIKLKLKLHFKQSSTGWNSNTIHKSASEWDAAQHGSLDTETPCSACPDSLSRYLKTSFEIVLIVLYRNRYPFWGTNNFIW